MGLQHDASLGLRVVQDLKEQVPVAVGRVVPEPLAVDAVDFLGELGHILRRQEAPHERVSLAVQLLGQVAHRFVGPPSHRP